MINNAKAGDAVERLIKQPMEAAGVTEAEIENADSKETLRIEHAERSFFHDVSAERDVLEHTSRRALIIEAVVFREHNKWEFSDGQSRFKASILDEQFLARVNAGEAFSKGDILIAEVRTTQMLRGGKLVTEHSIVQVKQHQKVPEQFVLPTKPQPEGG